MDEKRESKDDEDENNEDETKIKSSNFVCFCHGDICLLYLFGCYNKYDILKSTPVAMPTGTTHVLVIYPTCQQRNQRGGRMNG